MTCQEFLEGFTEYRDGVASGTFRTRAEEHLTRCPECRRYRRVVETGVEVLSEDGPLEVSEDFHPRLRHRLFHVDDEPLSYGGDSGAPVVAVLGMAVLLTAAAWSPLLLPQEPTVELSPIVVSRPPAALRLQPVTLSLDGGARPFAPRRADLWDDASNLLFQYSPVAQRYRQRALLRQAGLSQGR